MMTRNEYRQAVRDYFNSPGWNAASQQDNFPIMMGAVSMDLFIRKDVTSELAEETIRRMKQLRETGATDE